ncbi:TerC family protein [Buchnera aphidicola]|uniref:TerC family protein n=1 Tax=Buchnera aphidicola TaxID=9 RepID=UPI003464187B
MKNFFIPFFWSIFFFLILIAFIIDYIRQKKNKKSLYIQNMHFNDFLWLFLSCVFVFLLWLFSYYDQGVIFANSRIIMFLSGYLLEMLLSVDNVFVWFLIFEALKIPFIYHKKILLYGIWGSCILRLIIIFSGGILFSYWHWLLYFFGVFFLLTGLKIIFFRNSKKEKKHKTCMPFLYKFFRVTNTIDSEKFFLIKNNKFFITPLFVCLILIECSDIICAMDSIPAIFSVTNDFLIIFTSNILSVLALRSIYLLLLRFIKKFSILKYGLSVIFIFIGLKILLNKYIFISSMMFFITVLMILILTLIIDYFFYSKKL